MGYTGRRDVSASYECATYEAIQEHIAQLLDLEREKLPITSLFIMEGDHVVEINQNFLGWEILVKLIDEGYYKTGGMHAKKTGYSRLTLNDVYLTIVYLADPEVYDKLTSRESGLTEYDQLLAALTTISEKGNKTLGGILFESMPETIFSDRDFITRKNDHINFLIIASAYHPKSAEKLLNGIITLFKEKQLSADEVATILLKKTQKGTNFLTASLRKRFNSTIILLKSIKILFDLGAIEKSHIADIFMPKASDAWGCLMKAERYSPECVEMLLEHIDYYFEQGALKKDQIAEMVANEKSGWNLLMTESRYQATGSMPLFNKMIYWTRNHTVPPDRVGQMMVRINKNKYNFLMIAAQGCPEYFISSLTMIDKLITSNILTKNQLARMLTQQEKKGNNLIGIASFLEDKYFEAFLNKLIQWFDDSVIPVSVIQTMMTQRGPMGHNAFVQLAKFKAKSVALALNAIHQLHQKGALLPSHIRKIFAEPIDFPLSEIDNHPDAYSTLVDSMIELFQDGTLSEKEVFNVLKSYTSGETLIAAARQHPVATKELLSGISKLFEKDLLNSNQIKAILTKRDSQNNRAVSKAALHNDQSVVVLLDGIECLRAQGAVSPSLIMQIINPSRCTGGWTPLLLTARHQSKALSSLLDRINHWFGCDAMTARHVTNIVTAQTTNGKNILHLSASAGPEAFAAMAAGIVKLLDSEALSENDLIPMLQNRNWLVLAGEALGGEDDSTLLVSGLTQFLDRGLIKKQQLIEILTHTLQTVIKCEPMPLEALADTLTKLHTENVLSADDIVEVFASEPDDSGTPPRLMLPENPKHLDNLLDCMTELHQRKVLSNNHIANLFTATDEENGNALMFSMSHGPGFGEILLNKITALADRNILDTDQVTGIFIEKDCSGSTVLMRALQSGNPETRTILEGIVQLREEDILTNDGVRKIFKATNSYGYGLVATAACHPDSAKPLLQYMEKLCKETILTSDDLVSMFTQKVNRSGCSALMLPLENAPDAISTMLDSITDLFQSGTLTARQVAQIVTEISDESGTPLVYAAQYRAHSVNPLFNAINRWVELGALTKDEAAGMVLQVTRDSSQGVLSAACLNPNDAPVAVSATLESIYHMLLSGKLTAQQAAQIMPEQNEDPAGNTALMKIAISNVDISDLVLKILGILLNKNVLTADYVAKMLSIETNSVIKQLSRNRSGAPSMLHFVMSRAEESNPCYDTLIRVLPRLYKDRAISAKVLAQLFMKHLNGNWLIFQYLDTDFNNLELDQKLEAATHLIHWNKMSSYATSEKKKLRQVTLEMLASHNSADKVYSYYTSLFHRKASFPTSQDKRAGEKLYSLFSLSQRSTSNHRSLEIVSNTPLAKIHGWLEKTDNRPLNNSHGG